MEEQILSIGIDSEIKHVKSEIDRADAIFTVATGPIGHQEVNYHLIDEKRDDQAIRQSIDESTKEKSSLKSRLSPLQYQRTIESELVNNIPKKL